jgi:hypothetical protein
MNIDSENKLMLETMIRKYKLQTSNSPKRAEAIPSPSSLNIYEIIRLKKQVKIKEDNKVMSIDHIKFDYR